MILMFMFLSSEPMNVLEHRTKKTADVTKAKDLELKLFQASIITLPERCSMRDFQHIPTVVAFEDRSDQEPRNMSGQ